jgi:hypothetical protein
MSFIVIDNMKDKSKRPKTEYIIGFYCRIEQDNRSELNL